MNSIAGIPDSRTQPWPRFAVYEPARICESDFPIAAIPADRRFALAVIVGIEGASYRPRGAVMVVDELGRSWGSLSSGCLEQDVILHSRAAMLANTPKRIRYGRGSPYLDIRLPCGGALDILIIPDSDRQALARAVQTLSRRETAQITLGVEYSNAEAGSLCLAILPQTRFVVFGKGPEAACFANLARSADYLVELYSPDTETLEMAGFGSRTSSLNWPADLELDPFTAVTLFFHDHDRETALLEAALTSPAFYVGAQGSLRALRARCDALAARGVAQSDIVRLASPFGLIPSARDARTLAVSVLAHVLERARVAFRQDGHG